jgi:hypothetical protein
MNINPNFPTDIINIILDYDGRIKYRRDQYVNIIHKHDTRYNMITQLINKKIEVMKNITFAHPSSFYFEFGFDLDYGIGLCYDYNFSYPDKFEICYYDWRDSIIQIRTYL